MIIGLGVLKRICDELIETDRNKIKSKVVTDEHNCWVWQGEINRNGYGRVWINGKRMMSHRVTYEIFTGPIPDGYVVDHLCKNRACCNPEHLEAVTPRENTIRGDAVLFKRSE